MFGPADGSVALAAVAMTLFAPRPPRNAPSTRAPSEVELVALGTRVGRRTEHADPKNLAFRSLATIDEMSDADPKNLAFWSLAAVDEVAEADPKNRQVASRSDVDLQNLVLEWVMSSWSTSRLAGDWRVCRHGPLERLADNLWRVEGVVPRLPWYRRQMIVVRDELGRLLLHSAIALDADGMNALLALGTPTWLVVPNGYHRLDAPAYKAAFPQLTVITPAGSSARVARVVAVDMTYDEFPRHDQISMHGAPWPNAGEGVIEVLSGAESTLVFNDLIFNPPATGIYRLLRQGPQVPWLARISYAPDRARLRAWLLELSERNGLTRVIPGHGLPITNNAAATLRHIATTC